MLMAYKITFSKCSSLIFIMLYSLKIYLFMRRRRRRRKRERERERIWMTRGKDLCILPFSVLLTHLWSSLLNWELEECLPIILKLGNGRAVIQTQITVTWKHYSIYHIYMLTRACCWWHTFICSLNKYLIEHLLNIYIF